MTWRFEVTENGMVVAEGDAPDRETAISHATHYVMMYGQDGGDVQAIVREEPPRRKKKLDADGAPCLKAYRPQK